ncbi:MAG: ribonuclease E activity regulator RraA [Acidimicrobiia bacterium]|nr:ribonuclease E activity regulator RraA [Acidimicrobiia bacterium]
MDFATTDLSDENEGKVQIAEPIFMPFGAAERFAGQMATVKVHEDNVLVRARLSTPGDGRILVVDGGGSIRCALVGDILAALGIEYGWTGIVLNGCVRDSAVIDGMEIGVRALTAVPNRSKKNGWGEEGIPVHFAGVTFRPGEWLYGDADGILLSADPIH